MFLQKGFFGELIEASLVTTKVFASNPGVVIISPISIYLNKTFKVGVIICKQACMEAITMFGNVHIFNFYLLILSIY